MLTQTAGGAKTAKWLRLFVPVVAGDACAVYGVVSSGGRCRVEKFLEKYRERHKREYVRLMAIIETGARSGPWEIRDETKCRELRDDIYEFKLPGGKLRIFWFYEPDPGKGRRVILTHGWLKDGDRELGNQIRSARALLDQYKRGAFPLESEKGAT